MYYTFVCVKIHQLTLNRNRRLRSTSPAAATATNNRVTKRNFIVDGQTSQSLLRKCTQLDL